MMQNNPTRPMVGAAPLAPQFPGITKILLSLHYKQKENMEKYYQPIDGKNITFDKCVIEELFGVAGDVVASRSVVFGKGTDKYAFYNTGELCEVRIEDGRQTICVNCYGNRRKDILFWLKQYLITGMKAYGWETDIVEDRDDYFYAAFYQEETRATPIDF